MKLRQVPPAAANIRFAYEEFDLRKEISEPILQDLMDQVPGLFIAESERTTTFYLGFFEAIRHIEARIIEARRKEHTPLMMEVTTDHG